MLRDGGRERRRHKETIGGTTPDETIAESVRRRETRTETQSGKRLLLLPENHLEIDQETERAPGIGRDQARALETDG